MGKVHQNNSATNDWLKKMSTNRGIEIYQKIGVMIDRNFKKHCFSMVFRLFLYFLPNNNFNFEDLLGPILGWSLVWK